MPWPCIVTVPSTNWDGRAHAEACRLHPEPYRTYVVDRNINYSNWCTAQCLFCNFKAPPPAMTPLPVPLRAMCSGSNDLRSQDSGTVASGGRRSCSKAGSHRRPARLDWYLDLLRFIRGNFPKIHIHAFSRRKSSILACFRNADPRRTACDCVRPAWTAIPGGGAEILVDRVRRDQSWQDPDG